MSKFYDDKKQLTFDDVLIVPQYSEVETRKNINIQTNIFDSVKLNVPIISAAMDTVTGLNMIKAMNKEGASACLYRPFKEIELLEQYLDRELSIAYQNTNIGLSIGTKLNDKYTKYIFGLIDNKKYNMFFEDGTLFLNIDIAHADHFMMRDCIKYIRNIYPKIKIMAGNIVTLDAAKRLVEWGANSLKVGISSGGGCITRNQTAIGFPQLSAVLNIAEFIKTNPYTNNITIVSDGGIRFTADIVKAIAAGADVVMLGYFLAETKESNSPIYNLNNEDYKLYRGMASKDAKIANDYEKDFVEGRSFMLKYKGITVENKLKEISDGLKSAMSYVNADTIKEFQECAKFVHVTSNALIENTLQRISPF